MPEEFNPSEDADRLNRPPSFFPYGDGVDPGRDRDVVADLVEARIEGVYSRVANASESHVVVLTDGARRVDIQIGTDTAVAIVAQIEGHRPDRPLTHDLIRTMLERLGAEVRSVAIDDLWNSIYYAKIYLRCEDDDEDIEIDSRPSDALAIALRFGAPIYVADRLFTEQD